MGLVSRNAAVLLSGAAMAILLGAQSGWAQESEEVVVTEAGTAAESEQQTSGNGTIVLDQITVVSRTGESAIEQMASVSHVDQEQLERRMATSPQDVLFGVPGVAMQADSNRTSTSVNIRGLQDFGRVAVIVDGARQDFFRSRHGSQSAMWLDPELINQIDVIRGPVANTYGSGAIGGVVMFETKDADDFLRDGESWAASATGSYDTNAKGWTTSGTGAFRFNEAFDVLGNIVWRDFDKYKDGNGDRVAGSGFEVLNGMLKSTIRPTENSELKLGWIGATDTWTESGNTYDMETKQNTFTGRYNIKDDNESWLDLHINAAYNRTKLKQTYLTDVDLFDVNDGTPYTAYAGSETNYDLKTPSIDIWNTSRFDTGPVAHELTYGGDWLQDDVVTTSPSGGQDAYTPSGKRRVSGVYIQEKLTWEWLEVVGALRYDSYKLESDSDETSGNRLSPRITVGVTPFQDSEALSGLQFYGTYAEGYRSPSVTETLITGMHPQGVAFPFLPNPYLKPETAHTVEFGINYSRDGIFQPDDRLRLKAAYYNNDIDDYIGLNEAIDAGAPAVGVTCPVMYWLPPVWEDGGYYTYSCAQYQNYASAKIRGFELEGVYDAHWGFAGLSVSIIDGYTVDYDGNKEDLDTIPSSQVTGQLGFRFLDDKLIVGGEVQYNGAPAGNSRAKDYTLVNLFAAYQATDNLKFSARVDNLFDVAYMNPLNASTNNPLYEPGISFKMAASMRFGG